VVLTTVIGSTFLFAQQLSVTRLDGTKISPSQIDTKVTKLMDAAHVTGVGIAVWNDGKVVYLKTYGERNTEKHLPLTPDSVMTAASLAKPAFGTMVMQLVHEHLTELDKPVYEYLPKPLPAYPAYKDLTDDPLITMRMLLDHTSGFPNWRRFTDDKKLRIYFSPGSRCVFGRGNRSGADGRGDRHEEVGDRSNERTYLSTTGHGSHQQGKSDLRTITQTDAMNRASLWGRNDGERAMRQAQCRRLCATIRDSSKLS
jgi:CubicO group peptidase (beta-lactamase class C family)